MNTKGFLKEKKKIRNQTVVKCNLFILLCIVFVFICTGCRSSEMQFQFPLKEEDMEKVLVEQDLDWKIENVEFDEGSPSVYTITNIDGITVGILTNLYNGDKILSMNYFLPSKLTTDKFKEFYNTQLQELFDLVGVLYGNSKELNKGINEYLKYYYKNEENYARGVYWTKRIGDDHLVIEDKPWGNSKDDSRIGTLYLKSDKIYEEYLRSLNESWKNTARIDSIEIKESTIEEMLKFAPQAEEEGLFGKHFMIHGHLEDIKEIKNVPESLKNIKSSQFLKPNKDKYLTAKLIDDTGNINVFLQTTTLNEDELNRERVHNIVLFYYEDEPVYVVRFSVLNE